MILHIIWIIVTAIIVAFQIYSLGEISLHIVIFFLAGFVFHGALKGIIDKATLNRFRKEIDKIGIDNNILSDHSGKCKGCEESSKCGNQG